MSETQSKHKILEVCVDSAAGLEAAIAGGADRIELCAALPLGGLTPSHGLMIAAARSGVPIMALIRPRAGNFVYSGREAEIMLDDIAAARNAGLAGVVIGATTADAALDGALLERLVAAASGTDITLHRAFDTVNDQNQALDMAIDLGITRILTSGGAKTAIEGRDRLAALQRRAKSAIIIMPGSGIRADNLPMLAAIMPLSEIHASCSAPAARSPMLSAFGFEPENLVVTSADAVHALKKALIDS